MFSLFFNVCLKSGLLPEIFNILFSIVEKLKHWDELADGLVSKIISE
jgi:hypothetical protein